jgi:16S rRNA (guanine527-N7)-methyltransferase
MNLAERLRTGLAGLHIDLPETQRGQLLAFMALLEKWNKTYNLTAIHEPERMLTHHLLDSLAALPHLGSGRLLDVGSGAGLPGIPLAIGRPSLQLTLLDASHKKCAFMQQALIELGLVNTEVVHGRAESWGSPAPYAQIISRAFSDLSEFVVLTDHLLAPGGQWLAMKGLYPYEEISQLKGASFARDVPLHVPGLRAERHLILLERLP